MHPSGPRHHRRSHRLLSLTQDPANRPRFRAPRPAPSPFPPMLRTGPLVTSEGVAARVARRAEAWTRKALRVTRAEWMRDLRRETPQATRGDLRALLHRLARDRRDGV